MKLSTLLARGYNATKVVTSVTAAVATQHQAPNTQVFSDRLKDALELFNHYKVERIA